eukprot:2283593-Ditylum_brightwellii.AAC.1
MTSPACAWRVRSLQFFSSSSGNPSDSSDEKRPPAGKGRGQSPSRRGKQQVPSWPVTGQTHHAQRAHKSGSP